MKNSMAGVLLKGLLLLAILGGPVVADTLFLKNGKKFEGSLVSDRGGIVKFKTAGGVLSFPKSEVARVDKGATKADEYKVRLKKLEDGDIEGRLALARWCKEQKLFGPRKRLLRAILKACPDHPGARKESGQAWRGGKWVKVKNVSPLAVETGEAAAIRETRGKVAVPEGWERKDGAKKVTATGPNNYASAPVLTVEIIAEVDPAGAFPEGEGWRQTDSVTVAELTGRSGRRDYVENMIGRVEWLTVLRGSGFSVRILLRCLECESADYEAALEVALESLEFAAPPADYAGKYFQFNLPRPKDDWKVEKADDGMMVISHQANSPIEFGHFLIVSAAPGEEAEIVRQLHGGMLELIKATGDIEKEEEITISGRKGSLVQGTYLQGGIPVRAVLCLVEYGDRVCMIQFQNHEYGGDKTGHAFRTIIESFRFTK